MLQLLCQILNRMSSHTSCFQHVVQLDIPDLETIDHFPILSAVIGILLALLKQDMSISSGKQTLIISNLTHSPFPRIIILSFSNFRYRRNSFRD